jgi:hypothetical protein
MSVCWISLTFLYCNHQVHRDFLITLYKVPLFLGFCLHNSAVPAENTKIYYVFTRPCYQHARQPQVLDDKHVSCYSFLLRLDPSFHVRFLFKNRRVYLMKAYVTI